MTYEERKEKRLRKKKRRNIIIIVIFALFLARTGYGIIVNNPRTVLPKNERFNNSLKTQAVLIMDEKVYDIDGSLSLNAEIEEGVRLSKGYEIGKANIGSKIPSLNEELNEINKTIDLLNSTNQGSQVFEGDVESLESSRESLVKDIQDKINEKDYSGIEDLKDQMIFIDEKLGNISVENTLLGKSLDSLNSRKKMIEDQINSNSVKQYSQEAGIISFEIDGYEKLYVPKEFENYTYDSLKIPKEEDSESQESKVTYLDKYKIIDNFAWYLAIKVDNIKDIRAYEVNDSIYLRVDDLDRDLVGNIVAVNISENKAVYLAKFSSYIQDYYGLRFPDVEVFWNRKDAFSIPTRAIIDNDGQKGVYIKEFNGIVKFRPIEILGEKDDYTFVSKGDEASRIKTNSSEPVKTISLYDEILTSPRTYNEGDILN